MFVVFSGKIAASSIAQRPFECHGGRDGNLVSVLNGADVFPSRVTEGIERLLKVHRVESDKSDDSVFVADRPLGILQNDLGLGPLGDGRAELA